MLILTYIKLMLNHTLLQVVIDQMLLRATDSQESYYKTIVDSDDFNLDNNAFDGYDNDLVVSVTSQLGGLPNQIRQLNSNDIPSQSAIYCNTVHEKFYIKDDDKGIFSETNSPHIQKDS